MVSFLMFDWVIKYYISLDNILLLSTIVTLLTIYLFNCVLPFGNICFNIQELKLNYFALMMTLSK